MADLSAMYRSMIESIPNPADWEKSYQQRAAGRMELMEKQRQINDEQRLRELFAQNANPNISEIGAISPQFAQTFGKNQMEMLQKQYEMENTQSQIDQRKRQQDFEESKIRSNALAPIAEQYTFDVQSMGEPQAREKYHRNIGGMLAQLEAQGIKIPANFDPNVATPQAVLNSAIGFGYKSPLMQQQYDLGAEQIKSGMMPRRTPEQAYGGVEMTPQGPMYKPPVPTLQPAEVPQGAQSQPLNDADIQMMQQQFRSLPNGSPEKARIGAMLADAVKQQLPSGRFITPEERQRREMASKVAETTAVEEAKSAAAKKETAESKVSTLETLPPIEQINALIDQSMSSGLEARVKGITSGELGRQDESFTATAQLQPIQSQIKGLAKSLVGAGAISDYEQKMMESAAGAIADPRTPTEARKAALRVVYDINQKAIAKYPDLLQRLERSKTASGPAVGTIDSGYRFKGGDPAQANNWEKVQ